MKIKTVCFLVLFALVFSALVPITAVQAAPAAGAPSLQQFTAGGHALGFTSQGMYAVSGSHALHVDFLGANNVQPQVDSASSAAGNPVTTQGGAAPLNRVTYADLWEGITLTYHATSGSLYTTVYSISPGANAQNIRLRYNAPLTINPDGTLKIAFQSGSMTESAPVAWQDVNGKRVSVEVSFRVQGQEVTFALGRYDPGYALTIDPTLIWNTFLGGSGDDYGYALALDGNGNVYVSGVSYATWGTPVRAYTTSARDAFAAKLDSSGNLVWNTFLGGSGGDYGENLTVDGSGNVFVTGYSGGAWGCSPAACTVRAYTTTGGQDAFAAKLDSSGNLIWNTFLGGSGTDSGWDIAVAGGNVYVAGNSPVAWGCSPVACTLRAFTTSTSDAFIAKLDSSGNLTWNTFLGGSGGDYVIGITADGGGNVYAVGHSDATWGWSLQYPPVRAYSGSNDVFVTKLDSSGNIQWSTFLGGSGSDIGSKVAIDGNGNLYVIGESSGASWSCSPTPCTVRAYADSDAFVAKLNPATGNLTWNTFLGAGAMTDFGIGLAVDGQGNIYATGFSWATWGNPATPFSGAQDAYAAKLDSSGNLIWNTFMGGSGTDVGYDIGVDGNDNIYLVGNSSTTWGSPKTPYAGGPDDGFVVKMVGVTLPSVVSSLRANPSPTSASSVDFTVTFSENVTGVDTTDFTLTTTGVVGASVTGVSGSGATRTVSIDTGMGSGTIRLDVLNNGSIVNTASNPLSGPFTSGESYTVQKTWNVTVAIGGAPQGYYNLASGQSTRASYAVNDGPVEVFSNGVLSIMAAERLLYYANGVPTSFVEMMGLPDSQLTTTYWFPWYKNISGDIDTQLRLGNVSGALATVHVYIGGVEMTDSPFILTGSGAGQSKRLNFAGVNDGPVRVVSDVNIVTSERLLYYANGVPTSFSEMMGLPNSQLSTTYWFPWYKNIAGDIDTQLRLGNVSGAPATVHVYIGGAEMTGSPFSLAASGSGQSTRLSFAGVNDGPVRVVSDVNIVASERLLYYANGVPTSFIEMMGLPNSQLSTTWWMPWYKNTPSDIDTQLRLGNVSGLPATVHVYIGGAEMTGSPFSLTASGAGQSTRLNFAGVNNGPVRVVSNVNIVVSERLLYYASGVATSFSEMLGLPNSQLDTAYWMPWYKNIAGDIDTQLRFGVP